MLVNNGGHLGIVIEIFTNYSGVNNGVQFGIVIGLFMALFRLANLHNFHTQKSR